MKFFLTLILAVAAYVCVDLFAGLIPEWFGFVAGFGLIVFVPVMLLRKYFGK